MNDTVRILPGRSGGWELETPGTPARRLRVPDRAAAERQAREYLARHCGGRGDVLVTDAYHRVVRFEHYDQRQIA